MIFINLPAHLLVGLLVVLSGTMALPLHAQAEQSNPRLEEIDVITVIANRQPRQLSEVVGTVTVFSEEDIQRNLAMSAQDLMRYQPGIEVVESTSRFGDEGFRIRGIGGNRTAIVVDQVPVSDQFAVGNFSNSGRGLLELGLAGHVEVLRGPASTLYGSKALGGVVAIQLLNPNDLLAGETSASRVQLSGNTDSDRSKMTAATAVESGDNRFLLAVASQRGEQVEVADNGDSASVDPQQSRQDAILLRARHDLSNGSWGLSFDAMQESRDTEIDSILGTGRFSNTTAMIAEDTRQQWRLLFDRELLGGTGFDQGQWRLFYTVSDIEQITDEARLAAATPVVLQRDFYFTQKTLGTGLDLEVEFEGLGRDQRLGYGFEVTHSDVSEKRDAEQLTLATGDTTKTILGETFPLRDFPRSEVLEAGAYLHDEIELWSGGLMVSPGLRYEYYRMQTQEDNLFETRFPDTETTDLSFDAWVPKLGLLWPVTAEVDWFAQYAHGFRAPPFSDVNIELNIPFANVVALANPDLDPERGYTFETGVRWNTGVSFLEAVVYHNRYRNFIDSRASLGFDPDVGALVFQSINRDKVEIQGAEINWRYQWHDQIASRVALEYSRGEDMATGRAIADVPPPRAIVDVTYSSTASDWDTRVVLTGVRGQRDLENEAGDPLFSAPGYLTVDWISRWYVSPELDLTFGLFNLTDQYYWQSARVSGYEEDDPILAALAAPGRSAGLAMNYRF